MRIAHVTATFPPYYAGTGTVCYHNALGLARLGHEVTVFTARHPPGDYHYPDEITVRRLPVLFRIGNAPVLPGLLQLDGFDIIHLHHPFIFGAEMIWAVSQVRGIPYVLTHHNDLLGQGLRGLLFRAYTASLTRLVVAGARKLAVVSLDHAASCRLTPRFRGRWADVVEVPNGVDTGLFRPGLDGRSVRHEHAIPDEAPIILFVGALDQAHSFKGVEYLIKAFSILQDDRAFLMIVGGGDLRGRFTALAREVGVLDRTRFTGTVPHEQLPPYYGAASLVVLPSLPPESFGVVLLEAMACGKPVITSNIPGVRSVVSDGGDGLLVEAGDVDRLAASARRLLADPLERGRMGQQGRAKVEAKYAWEKVVRTLEQAYDAVVGGASMSGVLGTGSEAGE